MCIGTIVLINALLQVLIFRPLVKWSELFQYNAVGTAPEWPTVADVLFDFGKALKVDTVLVKLVSLGTKKLSAVAKYVFYVIGAALVGGLGYLIFWLFSPPYPSNILSQIPAALTVTTMRRSSCSSNCCPLGFTFCNKKR